LSALTTVAFSADEWHKTLLNCIMAYCCTGEHGPKPLSVAAWLHPAGPESTGREPPFVIDQKRGTVVDKQTNDTWEFDHTFDADAEAGSVYAACGGNVVDQFASSCGGDDRQSRNSSGCILAYGQRSAMKTSLMFGVDGFVSCAMRAVFAGLAAKASKGCSLATRKPTISISFLEICDGQINDLLDESEESVFDNPHCDMELQNLDRVEVTCEEDVMECVARGELQRRSLCSHRLLLLKLDQSLGLDAPEDAGSDQEEQRIPSQLAFADLAASEDHERVELLMLFARLLNAKADDNLSTNQDLLGFGTSKLACTLQPWLATSAQTVVVCTISPEEADHQENRKTLSFTAALFDKDSQEGTVDADQVPAMMYEVYWEEDVQDVDNDEEFAFSVPTPRNAASPCRERSRRQSGASGFGSPSPSTPHSSGFQVPSLGLPISGEVLTLPISGEVLTPMSSKTFLPASPPPSSSRMRRSTGRPARQPRQGSESADASPQRQGRVQGKASAGPAESSMDLTEVLNELRRLCEESQARAQTAEERANAEHLRAERMLERLKELEAMPRRSEGCGICSFM